MAILTHQEKYEITPTTGSVSQVIKCGNNILNLMYVKPATTSTTFDVELFDIYGNNILPNKKDNTGILVINPNLLTYGNLTLKITNASADEAFDVLFLFRES